MFKKMVFGQIVDINIVFNSHLVHHILLREVEGSRDELMRFDINGANVKFSKKEFLLVTKLWWSPKELADTPLATKSLRNK